MHEPYTSPPRNANGLTYARYPTPLTHSLHSEPTAVNPEPFCPDTSGLPYTRYRGTVRRTDLEERPAGCETAAARRVGFLISLDSGRMTFFRPGSLHPRRSLLRATCGGSSRVRVLLLEFAPSRLQGVVCEPQHARFRETSCSSACSLLLFQLVTSSQPRSGIWYTIWIRGGC